MALVAHCDLPSFARLRGEGVRVLSEEAGEGRRELRVGFLNMMPDAALEATERQFLRLLGVGGDGGDGDEVGVWVYPFGFAEIEREGRAREYVEEYYFDWGELRERGLDALVITGANPAAGDLTEERFWQPLVEVVEWAGGNVRSTLCSCLATHVVVKLLWGVERRALERKRWGVFRHRVVDGGHGLMRGVGDGFDAPHSHLNEVSVRQFEGAGLRVLAASGENVHLGVSEDGLRFVLFQGHPEYDAVSLLKEYMREVWRFVGGDRGDYPPVPENYFGEGVEEVLGRIEAVARKARGEGDEDFHMAELKALLKTFEGEVARGVGNSWGGVGRVMFGNWLGLLS